MYLDHLSVHHFRNLGVQELRFPPEGVAVIGENAQGKSNLLEAVYYLETFRSFRGARDEQLVAFDEPVFRIVGAFDTRNGTEAAHDGSTAGPAIAAAFQKRGRKKKITIDGVEPERIGDALGRVAVVIFSPGDVAMVSDGPGERRRFLDILLSLSVPTYLSALQRFRKILQHRNAALKAGAPDDHVRAWDHGLTESAGVVTAARARWIAARGEGFGRYHRIVSGGDSARMVYDPSVQLPEADEAPSAGAAAEAYADALHGAGDRDRRQGFTTAGPHRDDLKLVLDRPEGPLEIREYGSGGQRRTAALALRLVEADTLRDSREREPIILLDDVFAELDEGRSRRVLELIERSETGQVILTAPKESDVRIRRDSLPRWCIEKGVIRV